MLDGQATFIPNEDERGNVITLSWNTANPFLGANSLPCACQATVDITVPPPTCSPTCTYGCCDGTACRIFPRCGAQFLGPCTTDCDPTLTDACAYGLGSARCVCGSGPACTPPNFCQNGQCYDPSNTPVCNASTCPGGCCAVDGTCKYFPECGGTFGGPCQTSCNPTKANACAVIGSGPGICTCGSSGAECPGAQTCNSSGQCV